MSKYSVKRPYTVIVGVVLVLVLGVVSLSKMTADLLPNMSLPYVLIITSYPGASPEEVESQVTIPVEEAMATTSNIKNVSSQSYENYSTVVMEFEQSTNMDATMIEISQSMDQVKSQFPDVVGSPIIMQLDPDMMPIMVAAVEKEGMDEVETNDYVNETIIPAIKSVEGVASVTTIGGVTETVEVVLDQKKIDALNEKIQEGINKQFAGAKGEITSGKNQLQQGEEALTNGIDSAQDEISEKQKQLFASQADLTAKLAELKATKSSIEGSIAALNEIYTSAQGDENAIHQINQTVGQINQTVGAYGITINSYEDIPDTIATLENQLVEVNTGIATIESALKEMEAGQASLSEVLNSLNRKEISGLFEIKSGQLQLDQAEKEIDEAKENALSQADANEIFTMDTIKGILTAQNFSMPAGYVTQKDTKYLVRVGDKITDVDDLKNLVLIDMGMDGIEPITLGDVASVKKTNDAEESYARVNGNPGIMLSIQKQTGYSTGDVTDALNEKFAQLEKNDKDFGSMVLMDQGIYIDMIVKSVVSNMIIGAILAILVLLLFMKDFRPTLVIACSIPLSVVFAIVLMYFTGITLNVISLSGLALGIGMLVDNSIVVIENIYRMRNEGTPIRKAAIDGAKQVTGAIAASTLTTVCVFAPIVFTEGITRQIFVDMALTIAFSLLASLVVALTFVPMMSAGVLKNSKEKEFYTLDKIKDWYGNLIEWALHKKILVFVGVIALLVISVIAAFSRGMSFMPGMDGDQMTITVTTEDETTTMKELSALGDTVTKRLEGIDAIDGIGVMNGGGQMMGMSGSGDSTSLTYYVTLKEDNKLTNKQVEKQIYKATKDLDCDVEASSAMLDMSMLTGSGISVEITGNDLEELQKIAKDVGKMVASIEGTKDADDGLSDTTPSFNITVDKAKAAKYKMTTAQIFQLVSSKMSNATTATNLTENGKSYDVTISPVKQETVTLDTLKSLTFTYTDATGEEKEIPLSDVATFNESESLNVINRDAQKRTISVTAAVDDNHNVTLLSDQLQKKIDKYDTPDGYNIKIAGEDEQIKDAVKQVVLMMILGIILIYLIMVAQFQSLLSPFIIMFTIPLAFTGGFLALCATGKEVSVIALIGFVMLAGIIVNNGIVMVDYINQLRRSGMKKCDAIVEAGKTRLRPIMMTASTTILAMLLMAFGVGDGSEMMQPMAIVTIGGLVYGTLLTLIVVPCIYDVFNKEKDMTEEEY